MDEYLCLMQIKVITEITCHGKGAWKLFGKDGVVIDIGGQDTKGSY